jgi:alpha-D-ribose 1-methylphosphonate 5-triphosphate synthase subunit PhnG
MPEIEATTPKDLRPEQQTPRRRAMALLAEAKLQEIADGLAAIRDIGGHIELRPPETGLVMLRGRIGGDGAPFNFGEATVTRCAMQLRTGEIGFSYALGRDCKKARLAALCDALWQSKAHRSAIESCVLAPIGARIERDRDLAARRAAATRVDFFTLVRGEDQP